MWPDGTHPLLSQSQVVSVCQSFSPVAQFFFLVKFFSFFFFLSMEKRCGHIDVLKTFPGDTDHIYIYIYIYIYGFMV